MHASISFYRKYFHFFQQRIIKVNLYKEAKTAIITFKALRPKESPETIRIQIEKGSEEWMGRVAEVTEGS